jgi:glycosyltransferase involved in cell wall biosynthesis
MKEIASIHISQLGYGGAWNAATRISVAINEMGVQAEMECETQNARSKKLRASRIASKIDYELQQISQAQITTSAVRGIANSNWFKQIQEKHTDKNIWNLHWMPGYPSQSHFKLIQAKNVVWTLHDANPYTGICHSSDTCVNFRTDCDNCPQIIKSMNSLPKLILNRKLQITEKARNLLFVAPSNWIMHEFQTSSMGKLAEVVNIPNPIPEAFFMDAPKNRSKSITITILGSDYSESKNSNLAAVGLKRFMEMYPELPIRIQVIGKEFEIFKSNGQFSLPYGSSEQDVANFLKKSDVFIYTSKFDNLPNLVLEAQASGNFVLALNAGGVTECFIDQETGFTVSADPVSISESLEILLKNDEFLTSSSYKSSKFIRGSFSNGVVGRKYIDLYCELISRKQNI